MPTQNILATTMNTIKLCEERGRSYCIVDGASKFVGYVLNVIQKAGYIGEFEYIDDGRIGKFRIQLLGRINDCGVIVPRLNVSKERIDQLATKYLPSKEVGVLVISTSSGVMSHVEARSKGIGGIAVAYVY
ncbi:30S ribosomal protein S8 [Candidatus Marsarchaeota G2 archaeon ECH_B_SAG-F08]|jgi:small subunit ribosomal protein S8|uniref:Small ribosomal subunit protein uS8 n=4 Tax=Candidatus Marsarchaeota TaxID=1978152 RepID=A0A2R6AKD4_9ARCH|nr:MAG: 30S ribosomal protein S8 [Candidatus Marsarchaeota G1 archaeon BE_D]PSN88906.1 MAG: 30S ribosomal protein S8 [Candidatus Marsarchaeota G1 archaeon OSP_C]PSN94233.1 MAG: 30S ribosomal protein S8 [Candidatus Marsarchaeota G1 archaeon OSP_B]PSN97524.1 MAG: 30S ribosomal protein S8 [Candidatus Marsarchaeota G2 archaeon ECH_B_SAG-F08]